MDRITYAPVADASCMGLLMFAGDTHTVAITGHLEPTPSQGLHLYSALLGPSGSPALRSFTDPITALIRARKVDVVIEEKAETPAEVQPMVDEEPPAARSGRKKRSRTPKGQRLESDTKTLT